MLTQQSRISQLKNELDLTRERYDAAVGQVEELRQELQDVESVLANHQTEMSSLSEQLTEVCGGVCGGVWV